ncbi:Hypothetical protein R9X50_00323400 [Acrodontium crateriforme]|uniref:Pseudouridine synthase I TruA alpha/beta domain-containing protein n=1 Tax=Acrodontium crateriforme TaxID=150365 RepID=A0AAQ3M8N6_9PEZI|nr:Hypothetical protein R9X50_00323400 [Acrodontium crateriforme]
MSQPNPDYTAWSTAELIRRVTELEAELRAKNSSHTSSPTSDEVSPAYKKKPKKPVKPFDASRYHTRLIALKFAYLGGNYNGFEHHVGNTTPLPTIEEEIWKALRKTRLIFPDYTGKEGSLSNGLEEGNEEVCWEGVEYSKCGRTDRGVSAFGQVIGVKVRSLRPKEKPIIQDDVETTSVDGESKDTIDEHTTSSFDPIRDEVPYIQTLNRVLPADIRILAWCPSPPSDFSARFSCKERRYRYFFSNPAYATNPATLNSPDGGDGLLDIEAMRQAAAKYVGLHDFRNFCKVDASKQITNFSRRVFHAGIHEVVPGQPDANDLSNGAESKPLDVAQPKLYYFEVRGSAFLWHQVRHLVAVLFLVGQGYEKPSIIDELLDIEKTPAKPHYEMASDAPLVLWDCIFPQPDEVKPVEYEQSDGKPFAGYNDSLNWIYVGDERGGRERNKRFDNVEDGKYGRNGIMDELWALWRKRKIDEVLADNLMSVVAGLGDVSAVRPNGDSVEVSSVPESARVFDGSEKPRAVGKYIPLMKRGCMETPDVVNARYALRKGWITKPATGNASDGDD